MNKRLFAGTYGIVLTPFLESGQVDYAALKTQTAKIAATKALTGLVVCGSTGEFSRLSFEENMQLIKTVKESVGEKQFICGATAGDSYTAAKYVEEIGKIGADGILVAPPYYFTLTDEEIIAYYEAVFAANTAHIPIVGYNIPQCTNRMSVKVFSWLLNQPDFKGFKNSWNDMQEITTEIGLRNKLRPDVSMLTGLDACLYGTLALGGDGLFTAITYLMPEVMNFIYQNYGKDEKAFACQSDLISLIDVVNRFTFPYGYRVLSDALGVPLGKGREAVPASERAKAEEAMSEMRQIYETLMDHYIR